ncbi:MAG: PhnD/SsuA/transferrin family substrate-binding protein [bacterium]
MRIKTVSLLFVAIIFISASLGFSAEEKKKLLFIAPTFNIEGVGYSIDSIKEIGENLLPVIEKKTGLSFDYEIVGSTKHTQNDAMDLALERLKKGGDLSWMDYRHFKEARRQGIPLQPVAIFTTGGKITGKECLYVDTDKTYRKVEDLRDKRITGGYLMDWIGIRALLHENGIDERPDDFFEALIPVKTYTASLRGTLGGYIDTFFMLDSLFGVIKTSVPSSDKFAPLVCTDVSHNIVFPVYREGIDPEAVGKMKEIFFNVQDDPDMGIVAALMKQLNIYFIEATPEIMKQFEEEHQKTIKNGWFEEGEQYEKQVKAMEKKSADLKTCRKKCKKKGEDEKQVCIDLCNQKFK